MNNEKVLKIKDINKFSHTIRFMVEFIEYVKNSDVSENKLALNKFNFNDFMESMYGGLEDFKKYNLKDMEEDFKRICYYLETYEKINNLVEKI